MKENKTGLQSNLTKIDKYPLDAAAYNDIGELPEEFFTEGQLYRDGHKVERRGRGRQKKPTKKQLTIRLNNGVVDFFKGHGKGWQTEINDILQNYVNKQQASS